jgi:nucleotide-binding universal stress UspA family protein
MEEPGRFTVTYRGILVPLDGSERAETALPHAAALAERFGARIVLYRVVDPPGPMMPPDVISPAAGLPVVPPMLDTVQFAQEARDLTAEYLESRARELRALGLTVTGLVGDVGDVAEQILETARREVIDLIVMSTHGRTGLDRLLFGSVAENVVRHAPVPVLLIRRADTGPARKSDKAEAE